MNEYDPNYIPKHAPFLIGVKVLVLDPENKILIIQRSDKVSRPHGWDFPGGGVEKGENPSDSAIRETKEEAGLDIYNLQIASTHLTNTDGQDDLIIGYIAKTDNKQVNFTGWEHQNYRWVTPEELKTVELPNEHLTLLKAYFDIINQ